ncbi:hypothetical protein AGJ24_00955 [Cronobacter sakazakii]|nr:hypothetical protein [Cronobacter sakazakii]EGT5752018.1 hypothetical protein [Cronobacter sakazakii]
MAHQRRVLRSQNAGAVATGEFLSVIFSCGLRSAVCGLRSAVCGLRSAVCGLRSAVCGLGYITQRFSLFC